MHVIMYTHIQAPSRRVCMCTHNHANTHIHTHTHTHTHTHSARAFERQAERAREATSRRGLVIIVHARAHAQ